MGGVDEGVGDKKAVVSALSGFLEIKLKAIDSSPYDSCKGIRSASIIEKPIPI